MKTWIERQSSEFRKLVPFRVQLNAFIYIKKIIFIFCLMLKNTHHKSTYNTLAYLIKIFSSRTVNKMCRVRH